MTDNWVRVDAVRGANNYLVQSSAAQVDDSNYVTSFDSDGFTVGSADAVNTNTEDFVSWNWLGDGVDGGTLNENGSEDSYVNANTTAGFSVVKWTGTGANATIGHGLSAAPTLVLAKVASTTSSPPVGALAGTMDFTDYMYLDGTGAYADNVIFWNDTAPTASLISLGTSDSNISAQTMIIWCFHSVEGYSKVGSYTGNGNDDGTFVYLGFRPAFTMLKRIDGVDDWFIEDNKRNTYNVVDNVLYPNGTYAEYSEDHMDYVSNGMKFRLNNANWNASGGTYLYLAFASIIPSQYKRKVINYVVFTKSWTNKNTKSHC